MSKFMHLVNEIPQTPTHMRELTVICDKAMEVLHNLNSTEYEKVINELEGIVYHITKEQAETIVKSMKPYGVKWPYETVKGYLANKGIATQCVEWFLVMNMCYNDYHRTAEAIGKAEDVEFYYHLAHDFMLDIDSKPLKVQKYFLC